MKFRFLRWSFTWLLAFLPILFAFVKQFIDTGSVSFTKASNGEILIVAIVMIGEPLSSIISSERNTKNSTSMVLVIIMLVLILCNIYTYTLIITLANHTDVALIGRSNRFVLLSTICSAIVGVTSIVHTSTTKKNINKKDNYKIYIQADDNRSKNDIS